MTDKDTIMLQEAMDGIGNDSSSIGMDDEEIQITKDLQGLAGFITSQIEAGADIYTLLGEVVDMISDIRRYTL